MSPQRRVAPRPSASEPDFSTACQWWPDLPNIWTPIGWPDHLVRFNVLWSGLILAEPHLNRRTAHWAGQGVQVTIVPSLSGTPEYGSNSFVVFDDGMARQGWTDAAAPVLWTEVPNQGLLLRQEVFAHIPGGGPTQRGDEPLFAWVRLSLADTLAALPLEAHGGFLLQIAAPHLWTSMSNRVNVGAMPDRSRYPRELKPDAAAYDSQRGLRLVEPDGRVRLGVAPGRGCQATFTPPAADANIYNQHYSLHLRLAARRGAFVDVLLPMLPTAPDIFDAELALGRDAALKEANRYWAALRPRSAATFRVPEEPVNQIIQHTLRFGQVLTEKNPATGKHCLINGSWTYANLWTTPGAMDAIMLLDTLGYHDAVGKYLEIFRDEQGTVKPPGDTYQLHPGFFSTPELYKSIDWLSDNGAVLYMISMHALLSGDGAFAQRFTDCIVKSCDFIRESRARTGHGGVEGVLPSAVATDKGTRIQAIWNDGWNYKGLTTAVRLLRQLGHPRAEEFAAEAAAYKQAFGQAFRAACRKTRKWTDARGRKHPFVPTSLSADQPEESRHAFYLDTGPLFLVFAGLLDADDPLMASTRQWFRQGPAWRFYRHDSNCWQVAVLDHEMSSCEPCYSFNVFHNWQLGDRARFLEGLYSLLAGSISRKTFISCETRGGVTGNIFSAPLAIYQARLAVIDDQLRENELHLLRLMPLAWLGRGQESVFEQVPTEYGPVTLKTSVSPDGRTLEVTFRPRFRTPPAKVVLHAPPIAGLRSVRVNGGPVRMSRGRVELAVE